MTKVERFAELVAALDLPSWEHVGAFLISQGITESDVGDSIWFSCRCPVAQYLRKNGFPKAIAGLGHAWMSEETRSSTQGRTKLSISARQFIGIHDNWREEMVRYGRVA